MMARAADAGHSELRRSLLRGLVFRMKNKLLAGPLQDSGLVATTSDGACVTCVEKFVAQSAAAAARFAAAGASAHSQPSMLGSNGARMIIPTVAAAHK
jgi:hypothetical protein